MCKLFQVTVVCDMVLKMLKTAKFQNLVTPPTFLQPLLYDRFTKIINHTLLVLTLRNTVENKLSGLEVIQLKYSLKTKHNDWLLVDICPQSADHCAFFKFENEQVITSRSEVKKLLILKVAIAQYRSILLILNHYLVTKFG